MSIVTCRTPDCASVDQPRQMVLTVTNEDGTTVTVDSVVCGSCSEPITDIVDGGLS